ncbi:MAG: OB-fold domain-containing protein [Actinobacteria bacterium]|nr:OB-fold domain-containing protein [Actinomycetota bacterium]
MTTLGKEFGLPLPLIDVGNQSFWQGTAAGELRLQACEQCGEFRYPPAPACWNCHAMGGTWTAVSGKGFVYSWVIAHHAAHPGAADLVPYNIVIVELEEGPRLVSNLVDCPNEEIEAGLPVEALFEEVSDDVTLPRFRRSGR